MVSRREILKGAAGWPIVAAGGSSLLLWSTSARAWVPVALAVAQVGFQIYQMSRSGGGGIGKLLAAQVEMLRAINSQLREIGQTVSQIYEGVEQLKGMVEALPLQVTRQIYRAEVQAVSEYGSRLLDNGLINTQNHGIADAIILDNGASQETLDRLGPAVNAVASDPSVLNVPLMCLAWYTEYQLLTRYVPFNPGRIANTASLYQGYFERNIANLKVELSKIESEVGILVDKVRTSPTFGDASCFENISYDMDSWTCGHDGNFTCYRGHVTATSTAYTSKAETQEGGLAEFLVAASDLEAAGVKFSEGLRATTVPRWTYASNQSRTNYSDRDRVPPGYQPSVAQVSGQQCIAGQSSAVAAYYNMQDELKRNADDLRLRAIVNNHLLLAASEALTSCQTIAERVRSVQA